MKKILMILTSFVVLSFAIEDLGTYGKTELIEGKSFSDEIEERIGKLDIEKIKKQLDEKRKESFLLGKVLPTCEKTRVRKFEPTIVFKDDLLMPYNNKVLFKKNQKVNILKHLDIVFPYHLLFADADDEVQVQLAYSLSGKAMTMFVNGDISSFVDKKDKIYVGRKDFEVKSFNVECLPSIVTQQDGEFIINEYNPEDLIQKDEK